jgi:outer membrane protein TolC
MLTMVSVSGAKRLLASASMIALLSACAMTPEPFTPQELAQSAHDDRADMFKAGERLTAPLTVAEAIARALKYNLDRRAKVMEEVLALNQTQVDRWDLLPKLAANAGYSYRSDPNATVSRTVSTGAVGTDPSYSADQRASTADLGLSWNVLDFGLSYFTAKQNADRALIAAERKRKTVHNLVQEVRFAFWRAAAHQVLNDEVAKAVAEARVALDRAKTVEKENLKAPAEALRYQKSLLETLRQLTAIQQELSTAGIELAALINLPPGSPLALDVPAEMTVAAWEMGLEGMEETAFVNNADMREQGYLGRIAVNDTRKAIVRLFPGITFSASRQYDHNSFLMDNHWYEAGAKLSWNLMNLISGPDAIKYAETNEGAAKARRLALRMAVLAQVHVSERQYRNAVSQYQQSDELWLVDKRLFELSEAKTANDAQGMLERVAGRASAIASQLRRFQTYAQVEQSFAKMQASLGYDLMPETISSHDLPALSAVIAERLAAWSNGGAPAEPARSLPVAEAPPAAEPASATETDNDGGLFGALGRWFSAPREASSIAAPPPAPETQPQDLEKVIARVQELSASPTIAPAPKPVAYAPPVPRVAP